MVKKIHLSPTNTICGGVAAGFLPLRTVHIYGTTVNSFPDLTRVLAKLFTKVKVAPLVSGLEEASPGLGVNVSSLLQQQIHVLLAAPLYSDVQRCLP